jgi:Methyltransferase domain
MARETESSSPSFARRFAGELWHYDPSPALTAKAKRVLKDADIRFCQDAKSLNGESVDVVTSIAVWMTLSGYQACVDYLPEQHRLLRRGGRAFVVVTPPLLSRRAVFIL